MKRKAFTTLKWIPVMTVAAGMCLVSPAAAPAALASVQPHQVIERLASQRDLSKRASGGAASSIVIHEPPVPNILTLPVTKTSLSSSQLKSDVSTLRKLLSEHPGDNITRGPDDLVYNLDVSVDPTQHAYAGHMNVHFHNNLTTSLSTLYFNVWTDAPEYRQNGGYQQITSVTLGGQAVHFTLHGTVLTINLPKPVAQNASSDVAIDFKTVMPHTNDRYGWQNSKMNFGNWFPVMAVHDQYGWVTPPFFYDGESFYSITGAFHLNVTAPTNFTLAISGDPSEPNTTSGNQTTYHYAATGVRDVAMVGDSTYHIISGQAGQTNVIVYYTDDQSSQAKLMLNTAIHTVEFNSSHYGPYPFHSLRVAGENFGNGFGGMEYPRLVMVSSSNQQDPTDTVLDVAHEVSHQWFYSLVGDDQYLTPWIDESFADFCECRATGNWGDAQLTTPTIHHVTYPVYAFSDSEFMPPDNEYVDNVYNNGAHMLDDLMNTLGQTSFDHMMQAYFNRYEYHVATSADFMRFVSSFTGQDFTDFFHQHDVFENDETTAPMSSWAVAEMNENGRNWH